MFTHKKLVEIAYRWLLNNGGVGVAFKELKSSADEIPDVIGFDSWHSILIEVKVSRSDFLSDKKKSHRSKGMGNWRFYCCQFSGHVFHVFPVLTFNTTVRCYLIFTHFSRFLFFVKTVRMVIVITVETTYCTR